MTTLQDQAASLRRPVRRHRGRRLVEVVALVLCTGACAVGAVEASVPLGPGNTAVHHGYPFFATGMAAVLVLMARRSEREAPRWSALTAAVGAAYAVNALLIALLSYAVTPGGAWLPLTALGWLADVFFLVCDTGFVGLLVGLLPDARPSGARRAAVGLLLGLAAVAMLAEAFVPHVLDSTVVDNPLGLHALAPLSPAVPFLVALVLVAAVVLSVGTGIGRGWGRGGPCRRRGCPGEHLEDDVLRLSDLVAGPGERSVSLASEASSEP